MSIISSLNSLEDGGVIVICLKIEIPGTDTIYITNNNEAVTFLENQYISFPFQISELTFGSTGEVPQWQIQIDNTTRIMEQYLQLYDAYLKQYGPNDNEIKTTLYVVNALDTSDSILEEVFILESFSTDSNWASFTFSAKSTFTVRYPSRRILQNFCSWKFKSTKCAYSGTGTSCDKSIKQCRIYNNSIRFGGFPGISKGIRV